MYKTRPAIQPFIIACAVVLSIFFGNSVRADDACWCLNPKEGTCFNQPVSVLDGLPINCSTKKEGCAKSCENLGSYPIAWHCDSTGVDYNTLSVADSAKGCKAAKCWCVNSGNKCASSIINNKNKDHPDYIFMSQSECNAYCPQLGDGWKAFAFDADVDHFKDSVCNPPPPVAAKEEPKKSNSSGSNTSGQSANQAPSASADQFDNTIKQLQTQASGDLNPAGLTSASDVIGVLIRGILGIIGSLALVLYIYGGFTWMLSRGNSEKTATATAIIQWTTLGVIVMLASYLLVTQLFKIVGGNII